MRGRATVAPLRPTPSPGGAIWGALIGFRPFVSGQHEYPARQHRGLCINRSVPESSPDPRHIVCKNRIQFPLLVA